MVSLQDLAVLQCVIFEPYYIGGIMKFIVTCIDFSTLLTVCHILLLLLQRYMMMSFSLLSFNLSYICDYIIRVVTLIQIS